MEGDWVCSEGECGNVNFARRASCNRCGKRRPPNASAAREIGKSAAEKSRGLFSADDWQCGKCANVNWARRQTCNVCNAPRFGELEARTGYGGGYNERGVVEYRSKRDSDDDEYDEFGRKKRKVSGDGGATLPLPPPVTHSPDDSRRSSIMENRVTSTNDVKYRFRGKTVDEDFEVTYTLEERVRVVAWAIAYESCQKSATNFQVRFDKPAPDFKTIFAWRQRLLKTGCLVDAHSVDSVVRRRKKRRYFRPPRMRNTSDDSASDVRPQARIRNKSFESNENALRDEDDSDKRPTLNENNNTNGSGYRSSTSAKLSAHYNSKRSDCYMTDNARSATPEITVARVELAQIKSPTREISPCEDYFENDPKSSNKDFLIPEVPKCKKRITDDSLKNMLEDIVSESERYSSGPGDFDSDSENFACKKSSTPMDNEKTRIKDNFACGSKLASNNSIDPLSENFASKSVNGGEVEKNSSDNFTSAMRRMFQTMSHQKDQNVSNTIEYVPTKIDPAMAKRNHRLFNSTGDIWHDSSESFLTKKNDKNMASSLDNSKNNTTVYKSYVPDEDTLYRDDVSERLSNDEILTVPKAANIELNGTKTVTVDSAEKISSFLRSNLSSIINTEQLVSALKCIENMSNVSNAEGTPQKSQDNSSENITTKQNNIPFLDDIFYPGSPDKEATKESENMKNDETNDHLDLDDTGECVQTNKVTNSIISGFKSFALPKPIMLNRIRNLQSENKNTNNEEKNIKRRIKKNAVEGTQKNDKKLYDNEEDEEESGDEGDLSKYDLWGSDEENNKNKEKEPVKNPPADKEATVESEAKKKESSKSPSPNGSKRRSERSRSGSTRRSSSSSSSSTSSEKPRNRYDDFILNSEHSRAGSREDSSSARSRSPMYEKSRDKRRSRSRDKLKDRSRENRSRDHDRRKKSRDRDKGRKRDHSRDKHHASSRFNRGNYARGRAR